MQNRLEGRGASAPCSGLGSASAGVRGDGPVCTVSAACLGTTFSLTRCWAV